MSGVCDVFVSTAAAPKSQFAAKNQSDHLFKPLVSLRVCACVCVCAHVCGQMSAFFMCTP